MFDKQKNKVIVSGGSGFVGSWTIKVLRAAGYKVFNFDLKEGYDIRNRMQLRTIINEGDKVLHLAAIARFGAADEDPWLAYETNVLGTQNVAEVCKDKNTERLVYSSTGSVYMPIEQDPPITEEFKCRGNSVYACTKYLGELAIKKTEVPYIILRYGHIFGEGRLHHGAIGAFISRIERGLKPTLYGGRQGNDIVYVKDIVRANLLALEVENPEAMNQEYNIGTGIETSAEEIFNQLAEKLKYKGEIEKLPSRIVDAPHFVYDISKAKSLLEYKPRYTFKIGLDDYLK